MLKRRGEHCEFVVPGFGGRLTASENQAYTEVSEALKRPLEEFAQAARSLVSVKAQSKAIHSNPPQAGHATIHLPDGESWQSLKTLHKGMKSEILLCTRPGGNAWEYAIVESLDPTSTLAKSNGTNTILHRGAHLPTLLNAHIESESQSLGFFKMDIRACAEALACDRLPPAANLTRVVNAISAKCEQWQNPQELSQRMEGPKAPMKMRR